MCIITDICCCDYGNGPEIGKIFWLSGTVLANLSVTAAPTIDKFQRGIMSKGWYGDNSYITSHTVRGTRLMLTSTCKITIYRIR